MGNLEVSHIISEKTQNRPEYTGNSVQKSYSSLFSETENEYEVANDVHNDIFNNWFQACSDRYSEAETELNESTNVKGNKITSQGNNSKVVLDSAPSPKLTVCGKNTTAKFVIDLSQNVLYEYDESGKPQMAYSVATGRKNRNGESLTPKGIRMVNHVEKSPYKNVPRSAKRYGNPGGVYGPWLIYTTQIDPQTGKTSKDDGVFIHGNGDKSSLGKYVSKGCIRMDNNVITKLAAEVKRGQYIIVK